MRCNGCLRHIAEARRRGFGCACGCPACEAPRRQRGVGAGCAARLSRSSLRSDSPPVLEPEATLSIYLRTPFGRAANSASEYEVGARLRRAGLALCGPRRLTRAAQPAPTPLCKQLRWCASKTKLLRNARWSSSRTNPGGSRGWRCAARAHCAATRSAAPGSARAAGARFVIKLAGAVRSTTEGSAEINRQRDPGASTTVQSGPKAPTAAA